MHVHGRLTACPPIAIAPNRPIHEMPSRALDSIRVTIPNDVARHRTGSRRIDSILNRMVYVHKFDGQPYTTGLWTIFMGKCCFIFK